jgi:glycerol uptake facilitator protein
MTALVAEFTGTAILLILGNGVVANVVLNKTKGNNGGLIAITLGWAMAVFVAVFISANASGAHLNPAVTLALAIAGKFEWALVPGYCLAQLLGAMLGAGIVWLAYRQHFDATEDASTKLAVFSTSASIRSNTNNFIAELVATAVFVIGVLFITGPTQSLGSINAIPVAFLVLAIGLSLGGPTGYAINPARDLGPRIMHALLPIKNKGTSDWGYAWLPVIAPMAGAALGALIFVYCLQ